jgi:hypothetical protein
MKRLLLSVIIVSAILVPSYGAVSALPAAGAEPVESPTPAATPSPAPVPIVSPSVPLTTTLSPPEDCPTLPTGSFLAIWQSAPALQAALSCPTSYHPRIVPQAWEAKTSYQPFEHGRMIWSDHQGWYAHPVIFVIFSNGRYRRFEDTFDSATDPVSGGETPPDGLREPVLGFGKVWREHIGVRNALGWAIAPEISGTGYYQLFMGGHMVWIAQTGRTYVFIQNDGVNLAWIFDVPFTL